MQGNIHQFVEKVLDEKDQEHLVAIWNKVNGRCLHLGLLPFVNHDAMISTLMEHLYRLKMRDFDPQSPHIGYIKALIDKLDEDNYWVDVTAMCDEGRREYNTVTGRYRVEWLWGYEQWPVKKSP